jgi:catechol 2,3-dioxygenase-like lactoylglutathione lyase family enzyme
MKINLSSVSVGDQENALKFYTEVLGFKLKRDIPMGSARFLTVVSPENPDGTELLLEPNADYPAMKVLKESLRKDGIPFTAFEVDDIHGEVARLKKKDVQFSREQMDLGTSIADVFDDTCGNFIMIYQVTE